MTEAKRAVPPGECCDQLRRALSSTIAHRTLGLDEDGMLWIGLGYESVDNRVAWISNRVDYCPFCGSEIDNDAGLEERKH